MKRKLCAFVIIIIALISFSACKKQGDTFTLFYNTNGGDPIASVRLKSDQRAPLPTPVNGNKEFLGWYSDNNFEEKINGPLLISKDTTIYAAWKTPSPPPAPKTHIDITFRLSNSDDTKQTIPINTKLEDLPALTKDGYHLQWFTSTAYNTLFSTDTILSDDTIIYGRWRAIFNISSGSITSLTEYGKTLKDIVVPLKIDNVEITRLASSSFRNCPNLETVVISSNIAEIGSRIFSGSNKLQSITVDGDNAAYQSLNGVLYSKDKSKLIAFPKDKTVSQYSVNSDTVLIENDAFGNCKKIIQIILPASLETIELQAFSGCNADIIFSEGITTISQNVFSGYTGTKIILPNSVTTIEEYAFKNSVNLTELSMPSSLESIGEKAFYMCKALQSLTLPDSIKTVYADAFIGCDNLLTVAINSTEPPDLRGAVNIPQNIVFYVIDLSLYEEEDIWKDISNTIIEIAA